MSVIGELQRYLDVSVELLATHGDPGLVDALSSARPASSLELPICAESILETLAAIETHLRGASGEPLSADAAESVERLRAICRIVLGRPAPES